MPNININIRDTYDGSRVRQATRDVEALNRATHGGAGGVPGTVQSGAVSAAQSAPGGMGQVAPLVSPSHAANVSALGSGARRSTQELASLRRELEAISHLKSGTSDGFKRAMQVTGMDAASMMQFHAKSSNPSYAAGINQRIADLQARDEQNALNYRLRLIRNSNAVEERRVRRSEMEERMMMNDHRRSNFDNYMAGGILSSLGHAAMAPVGYGIEEYGKLQLSTIATEAVEGSNAPAAIKEAKSDALNTYGASYRDILSYQALLQQSGENHEEARQMVLSLSDVNASMGGTADRMNRVIYNLTQVENQGHLTGRDLRDFQVNLIPLTEYLAKIKNVDKKEIAGLVSDREVSSQDVRKAIAMMGQDPRFAGRGRLIANETIPGQIEKAHEKLSALGEVSGKSVAPGVEMLTNSLGNLAEFLEKHPALTAGGTYALTGVGGAMMAGGGLMLAKATLGTLGQAMPFLQKTPLVGNFLFGGTENMAAAKMQITAAQLQLAAARANGVGAASRGLGMPPVAAGGTAAAGGAGAGGAGALGAGAGAGAAAVPWYARTLPMVARFGGGAMTAGAVAGGVTAGVVGAYQQHGDMKALGASSGTAFAVAAGTGITETLIAAFVPGGVVAVALAEGIRFSVNELYNKPMEKVAGPGELTEEEIALNEKRKSQSPEQRYLESAARVKELTAKRDAESKPGFLENALDYAKYIPGVGPLALPGKAYLESRRHMGNYENQHELDNALAVTHTLRSQAKRNERQVQQSKYDAEFEAFAQSQGIGTGWKPGADSGEISNNRRVERKVKHNSDLSQTITLTLPPHPSVRRVTRDMEDATAQV